jgi:hypothetical protein
MERSARFDDAVSRASVGQRRRRGERAERAIGRDLGDENVLVDAAVVGPARDVKKCTLARADRDRAVMIACAWE